MPNNQMTLIHAHAPPDRPGSMKNWRCSWNEVNAPRKIYDPVTR